MMKYFFVLAFGFSLLALAPLAMAQSSLGGSDNTGNTSGSSLGGSDNTLPANNTTNTNNGQSITLLNPLNSGTSLPDLLTEILQFVVRIGTVVIVLMVIYVGFKFVMAQGEPGAISEARQALLWTVVGALILLGAQAIATAIQATANAL